jgi:uncharacterized membrane protein
VAVLFSGRLATKFQQRKYHVTGSHHKRMSIDFSKEEALAARLLQSAEIELAPARALMESDASEMEEALRDCIGSCQ